MEKELRPRAAVCTLGCRVNQYESEVLEAELVRLGFVLADFSEKCDVYIVNTCAVTGESERKSQQMIRRAAATNPDAFVLVTGCFSQLHPESAAALRGVDYVCGNRNKLSVAEEAARLVREGRRTPMPPAVLDVEHAPLEKMTLARGARARVFVKIEDGCDNHCTYCAIRRARGDVVSRPMQEILSEVRSLVQNGCREVILTGIEVSAYGRDRRESGESLPALLEACAEIPGVLRVRLGSLEPSVLTPSFCDVLARHKTIMPSFHLSLQSGSNAVLAAMKRRYNREQVLEKVAYLRSLLPEVTLSCDLIVGFPGESEADFADTMALAESLNFLHMHVFPFSPREGTLAAAMENQVPEAIKRERAKRLEALGKALSARRYEAAVGTEKAILIESRRGKQLLGHTAEMFEVSVRSETGEIGELRRVRILGYDGKKLVGAFL